MGANAVKERAKYFNVTFGKVVQSVSKETPNAVFRVNGNGKDVYELIYSSLSGRILDITIFEDKEYGDKCRITLDDVGERMVLQFPVESRYFNSLACKIRNIPTNTHVTIKPYDFKAEDDKRVIGLNILEGDEKGIKVLPFITKENPCGIPAYPENPTKNAVKKWSADREEFLIAEVNAHREKFHTGAPVQDSDTEGMEADDLPF